MGRNFIYRFVTKEEKNNDYTTLSTGKYISNSYEISDDFNNLSIGTDTANIVFALSDNEICKVDCYEKEKAKHSVSVKEDNIHVENVSAGSLNLFTSTGKITVANVNCSDNLTVNVSTGNTYMTNITCKNLTSSESTGNISLNAVIATEVCSIRRSTGNIKIKKD